MRKVVLVLGVAAALMLAGLAYAMDPQPSPGKKEASISLTAAQAESVANARGSVEIQLTSSQVERLKGVVDLGGGGEPRVPSSLTLSTKYVRANNKVVVVVSWDARGAVSINPVPSP